MYGTNLNSFAKCRFYIILLFLTMFSRIEKEKVFLVLSLCFIILYRIIQTMSQTKPFQNNKKVKTLNYIKPPQFFFKL